MAEKSIIQKIDQKIIDYLISNFEVIIEVAVYHKEGKRGVRLNEEDSAKDKLIWSKRFPLDPARLKVAAQKSKKSKKEKIKIKKRK